MIWCLWKTFALQEKNKTQYSGQHPKVKVPPGSENNTTLKVTPIRINLKCTGLSVYKGDPYHIMVYECVIEDIIFEELEGRKKNTDDLNQ